MRTSISLAVVALACCGCAPVIHKQFSVETDPPISLSIDAKQRIAWVLTRKAVRPSGSSSGQTVTPTDRVICAEPSPDAMVGIAAALGLDVPFRGGSVGFEGKLAEAVSQMGTRTQTIQLLRDGLYRACEAYLNGVLDETDYETVLRHYDSTMIMLVTIDGLTQGCGSAAAISTRVEAAPPGQDAKGADDAQAKPAAPTADSAAAKAASAAADAAGVKGAAGATRSAAVSATAQPATSTRCALSDKTAEKVGDIMTQYFAYKIPIQIRHCIRQSMALLGGGPQHLAKRTPTELTQLLEMSERICSPRKST